jgi:hypothetical protein
LLTKRDLALAGGLAAIGAAVTTGRRWNTEHRLFVIAGAVITILQAL